MIDEDTDILATSVLEAARQRGLTIATAESCTGGLVSAALTSIAGSSDVFDRGFITYTNEAKQQNLGVSTKSLDSMGAVSEAVVKEMAYGALANSMADIAVSVTGIAGPGGGSRDKPVGTVWIGVAQLGETPIGTLKQYDSEDRSSIRGQAVVTALSLLLEAIAS